MALVNLSAAVNGLYPQTKEFGYNKTKEAAITAALASFALALTSDTTLTGAVAIAAVKSAIFSAKMAIEAGQGRGDGSGYVTTSQKVVTHVKHVQDAYNSANAALIAPAV